MIEKQLKIHSGQTKDEGTGAKSGREGTTVLFFHTPDMETLLANQRHAAEAVTAATEKLLEGIGEISRKQLALHNSLMQQAFQTTLGYLKSDGKGPGTRSEEAVETTAETTLKAMRDIASTALKCNLDALSAFNERIHRMEGSRPGERSRRAEAAD